MPPATCSTAASRWCSIPPSCPTPRPARCSPPWSTSLPDLPDTPTATEVGLDLKGFRARSWFGLFAPRGTPEPVLARLSGAAAQAAALPDMKEKLLLVAQNVDYQSNVDFARQVRDDQIYFAQLLKDLDIKLE